MKVYQRTLTVLLAVAGFVVAAHAQWVKIGGESAGPVLSLTERDSLLVVGSQSGRVTVSSDFGTSWYNRSTDLPGKAISSVVFHDAILFAGTRGEGVYRSTNDGLLWMSASSGLVSKDIMILDVHDGIFYAGTSGAGIYRSTDDGLTWEARNAGLTNTTVLSLAVKGAGLYIGTYGGGVFRSTNGGAQWTWSGSGLTNLYIPSLAAKDDTLYAGSWGGGIYQSTTGGASWTAITGEPFNTVWDIILDAGDLCTATAEGVFRSSNSGLSWSKLSSGWSVSDARCATKVRTALCVGTAGGEVMISTNGGISWTMSSPVTLPTWINVVTVQLDSDGDKTSVVYAGGENGLFRSADNGENWTKVNRPSVIDSSIWTIAANPSHLFLNVSGTLYVSTNSGTTWTQKGPRGKMQITGIALQGKNVLVGTDAGVYYSSDNGASWALPGLVTEGDVNCVEIAPSGSWGRPGITLFAGLTELYSSVDSGRTWQVTNLPSMLVRSLVLLPRFGMPGEADLMASVPDEVHRSTDAGVTWTIASRGLPAGTIYDLSVNDGILFGGTERGVYWTTDRGDHWALAGDNPLAYWYNCSLDVNGEYVYAVSDGLWRYRWGEQGTSVEQIKDRVATGFCLFQNFPNPCNPTTSFIFSVPRPAHVTLSVYNTLGEHVATLFAGELIPGTYSRSWSAAGLASGVYFSSLEASWTGGSYRETRKLIVLR